MGYTNSSFSTFIITSDTVAIPNANYICNSASLITITLPLNCPEGAVITVTGIGTGGWQVNPNTDQIFLNGTSSVYSPSGTYNANITFQCVTASTTFTWISSIGSPTTVTPRGLFGGGYTGSNQSSIEYVQIATDSNGMSFGNLTAASFNSGGGGMASYTRGVFFQAYIAANTSAMDYVTIATTGNAASFGTMTQARGGTSGTSNSVRGLNSGGYTNTYVNTVDFITIATTNVSEDFGDLVRTTKYCTASCASPTRAIVAGGDGASIDTGVEYFTIATKGNATLHCYLTQGRRSLGGCSSGIKGFFCCGGNSAGSTTYNVIDHITIATTDTMADFGDATAAKYGVGCFSSSITGVIGGGNGNLVNIDKFGMSTNGNATNFGNLLTGRYYFNSLSNDHGGLQ